MIKLFKRNKLKQFVVAYTMAYDKHIYVDAMDEIALNNMIVNDYTVEIVAIKEL